MDTVLFPIMWLVSWVMYGIHKGLTMLGMAEGAGTAWVLAIIGLTIVVRVLGLILCALAVQFILAGIAESTAGVILREAAAPYAK